tara:strand:- start:4106 stop:5143 length:1038 start_codon:yes stop_codon:yes gene_type:complete
VVEKSFSTSAELDTKHHLNGRVLVVGSGEIGTRHLQAVASLSEVSEIEVVDPRAASLQLGQERLAAISDLNPSCQIRWLTSIDEACFGGGLCIVATQAEGRYEIVRDVVKKLNYQSFLLEKVVTQSLTDYERLLALSEERHLNVWINCKTRAYPFHKRAIAKFDPQDPIQFFVNAGNHGLAVNGIHSIDLFTFYDRCSSLMSTSAYIDPTLHPSKRGNHVFDLSGILEARSEKGSRMVVSYAHDHLASDIYVVSSKQYRFVLDHTNRWAFESDAETGWVLRPVAFEGDLRISHMSKAFVSDILSKGVCDLPTLHDCYIAHEFMFSVLQPEFSVLMGQRLKQCPIT